MLKDISLYTGKYRNKKSEDSYILKSDDEINKLRESAGIVRDLLLQLHKIIKPGINELDIASFCENYILIRDANPYLKTEGFYPHAVMISRNNIAFHGIPEDNILREGDILTVDIVLQKNGWFGDGAWTYEVGSCADSTRNLVSFSKRTIEKCISNLERSRNLISIAEVIEIECKNSPFRVINEGAGHGIGLGLHEEPQILFGTDAEPLSLKKGMVFTIEPVFTDSTDVIQYSEDGSASVPAGFFTVQYEHMIAVNERGIEILTSRNPFF